MRLEPGPPAPPQATAWALALLLLGRGLGFPAGLVSREASTEWAVGVDAELHHAGGVVTRAFALLAPASLLRQKLARTEIRVAPGARAFAEDVAGHVRELLSRLEKGHKMILVFGQARDDSCLSLVRAAAAAQPPKWLRDEGPPVPGPAAVARLAALAQPRSVTPLESDSGGLRYAFVASDGVYTTLALLVSPELAVEEVLVRVGEAAREAGEKGAAEPAGVGGRVGGQGEG